MAKSTMRGRGPANSLNNTEPYPGITYDSALPEVMSAIDGVCAEMRSLVAEKDSQRFASYALWLMLLIRHGLDTALIEHDGPENVPHPRELAGLENMAEPQSASEMPVLEIREARRPRKTEAAAQFHLGGVVSSGATYKAAGAITEQSETAELVRGLDNLHEFVRGYVTAKHHAAKAAVREYARIVALLLGVTERRGILGASRRALRHWDVLAMPRSPAPGLQLPVASAPLVDIHALLDSGQLCVSFATMAAGENIPYEQLLEQLRKSCNGNEAVYQQCVDVLAYTKVMVGSVTAADDADWQRCDDPHDAWQFTIDTP